MVRRLAAIGVRLVPVALFAVLVAGCGGDSTSEVSVPAEPGEPGSVFSGTVSAPNGQIAALAPSALHRLAGLVVGKAEALYATNVRAVGRNVGVLLSILGGGGGVTQTFGTGVTNDQGAYAQTLPPGTSQDTCRFAVSVGTLETGTLTRAFVYSLVEPINIDFNSEAAVAVILGRVQQGVSLCEFSSQEIKEIVTAIRQLSENITADNVFETNRNATIAAASSSEIQRLLDIASGQVAAPTATQPAAATPTVPAPPTNTSGPAPTSTFTRTPVPTNTPRPATSTPTKAPPTNTRPPATATKTAGPTNTPRPSNTPLPPTATPTPQKTPPAVSIGSVSGAPGAQITLPFSLTKNSYQVVTIAPLVVGFDPTFATFNSCVSKVTGKSVTAGLRENEPDRLAIVMQGDLSVIPDGPIVDCLFTIPGDAEPTDMAVTFEEAGMAEASGPKIDATGSDGTITVTAGGVATATPTSPATATPTPTVGASGPRIGIGSASGAAGAQVSVPISLTKNGPNIVTIAPLAFTFDPNLLTFGGCTKGAGVSAGKAVNTATPSAGRVTAALSGDLVVIPDGVILDCTFTIAAGAASGPTALTFQSAAMSDDQFNDYDATGSSGSVTVGG